jgi:hypothetical protein
VSDEAPTLEELVAELVALDRRREALRSAVFVGMTAAGVTQLKAAGGTVSLVAASTSPRVDTKAAELRIGELAAQLVALGQEADDSIPMLLVPVAASIRVTVHRPRQGRT